MEARSVGRWIQAHMIAFNIALAIVWLIFAGLQWGLILGADDERVKSHIFALVVGLLSAAAFATSAVVHAVRKRRGSGVDRSPAES